MDVKVAGLLEGKLSRPFGLFAIKKIDSWECAELWPLLLTRHLSSSFDEVTKYLSRVSDQGPGFSNAITTEVPHHIESIKEAGSS